MVIEVDDVSGLFAAEDAVILEHPFEDVLVSDLCPNQSHPGRRQRLLEAEVGHDGRDHEAIIEPAAAVEVAGPEQQDLVAVPDASLVVDEDRPIGVTIERDPGVGSPFAYDACESFWMECSGILIDVPSIGGGVDDLDGCAASFEHVPRDLERGTVSRVDDQRQTLERPFTHHRNEKALVGVDQLGEALGG